MGLRVVHVKFDSKYYLVNNWYDHTPGWRESGSDIVKTFDCLGELLLWLKKYVINNGSWTAGYGSDHITNHYFIKNENGDRYELVNFGKIVNKEQQRGDHFVYWKKVELHPEFESIALKYESKKKEHLMENKEDKKWYKNRFELVIHAFNNQMVEDKYNANFKKLKLSYPLQNTVFYISLPADRFKVVENERVDVSIYGSDVNYIMKYSNKVAQPSIKLSGAEIIKLICEHDMIEFKLNHNTDFVSSRTKQS